jgi:tetratricopeptide (TPR) repeat protein
MRALLHDAAQLANTGGNYVRLAELGERLVALHERRADDPLGYARALHALGAAKYNLGDAEGARQMLARALEAYREVGDPRGIAIGLMNLAAALSEYGTDEERAQQLFEESLEIYRSLGLSANMGIVLANLAAIAARRGDYAKGIDYGAQSFEVFERLGNKIFASWPLVDMAGYRLELGDVDECRNGLRKAGEYLDEDSNVKYVANFCDVAFCLAVDAQRYENAARIHGYIERFRDERDVPRLPADGGAFIARLARLREILDPPQLERLAAEGRDWTFARTCETLD